MHDTISQATTLPELLAARVKLTPQLPAYRAFDDSSHSWRSLTWSQTDVRVGQWRQALMASALPQGARVAILLPNGLNAMSIDLATLSSGMVPVPLHAIDNPGSIAYILGDAQVSVLFVADPQAWSSICGTGHALPDLSLVVITHEGGPADSRPIPVHSLDSAAPEVQALRSIQTMGLTEWLAQGQARPEAAVQAPTPEDLAAVVYTSGTTGRPKGVMLTHRNVVTDVQASLQRIAAREDDVFLSFLPLSHTFERTAGYYLAMAAGSCVAYARSVALLQKDLKTVRPTVLVSVPRIYERVHAKVWESLSGSSWKKGLFQAAQDKGWKRFCAAQGIAQKAQDEAKSVGWQRLLPWPVLEYLVARPLRAQFGGRLRVAVSGGAPLSANIAQCFLGLGLPVVQGYGMTETSPVVSVNTPEDNHPASVGRALPGVNVRIGENQELQVSGPIVMRGYWRRPEDTAKALTADGWLRTGDQAVIEDGRIRIQGRIKEIIVTSTGEKIPPADLELAIAADPLFAQVFVVGEDRPFIACVAVVETDEWTALAKELGLDPHSDASLNHAAVEREALKRIQRQTQTFARYAVPRAVHLVSEAWSIENGLMTPTLKLKRSPLMARYESAINAMYGKPEERWQNKSA